MRLRYIIVALLYPCFSLFAQKPLSIGDTVPDIKFEQLLNYPSNTARLSDFKNKLVILDFWATWCGSCLHAMPKMDSLQSEFEDQLKVLLVNSKSTRDQLSTIQAFFTKWANRTGKKLELATVVNDTITDKLFPHSLIPHYVWIGKSGRVIAITSSGNVNAATIRDVLDGVPPSFTMKKDQQTARPIFSGEDLPVSNLLHYAVLTRGWFDGLPSGNRLREKDGITRGRAITNTALLDIYKAIANAMEPSVTEMQVFVVTDDSSDLLAPPAESGQRDDWYKDHAYTLDVIVPKDEAAGLYQKMLEVLNDYSGYTGQLEKRKMKCWVLQKKDAAHNLRSKGGETENKLWDKESPHLTNGSISLLLGFLNNVPAMKGVVINETGYTGNLDLAIEGGFSSINDIRRNLSKNGLVLKQEERLVKVFVVRKK